jgi:hypothetical protein
MNIQHKIDKVNELIVMHKECIQKLDHLLAHFLIEAGLWSWDLEVMTKDMNVPEKQRRNLNWLVRNLPYRNHPYRQRAIEAVRKLLDADLRKQP